MTSINAKIGGGEAASCNICCENYNRSNRNPICCCYCEFTSCSQCCETYVLSESIPKCMNTQCGKEWSRKFMTNNFAKSFMTKKYKVHLENLLFDREKALLPATQPIVERIIKKEKIDNMISDIDKTIRRLKKKKEEILLAKSSAEKATTETPVVLVRSCPAEDCRGFLNSKWICGMCESVTCNKCHELKTHEDHVCNPDSVETAKALEKETKPCPVCKIKIFKISGCDQMWCTQCKTAFSWKTGAIETNIHNPHYYEWRRQNGGLDRAIGDIECGQEITHQTYDAFKHVVVRHPSLFTLVDDKQKSVHRFYPVKNFNPVVERVFCIIRNVVHVRRVVLLSLHTDVEARNQVLRIQYMRNTITEAEFKACVQKADKKHRKNAEILQIIQLMLLTVTDIILRFIDNLKKGEPNEYNLDIVLEIDQILNYCNKMFQEISVTYNCRKHFFNYICEFDV